MSRLTFKKLKGETGLRAVGHPYPETTIKQDKMKVGTIYPPSWKEQKWRIGLIVSQTGENCPWRWVQLKKQFDTEPDARKFIVDNIEQIRKTHDLYPIEPFDD